MHVVEERACSHLPSRHQWASCSDTEADIRQLNVLLWEEEEQEEEEQKSLLD